MLRKAGVELQQAASYLRASFAKSRSKDASARLVGDEHALQQAVVPEGRSRAGPEAVFQWHVPSLWKGPQEHVACSSKRSRPWQASPDKVQLKGGTEHLPDDTKACHSPWKWDHRYAQLVRLAFVREAMEHTSSRGPRSEMM